MHIICCYCGEKTGTKIDTAHDAHSYCWQHRNTVRVCNQCSLQNKKCPICGKSLSEQNDSLTKKTFFHGPTRDRLGF